ncbi:hypothetical protein PPERSA_12747 [Pseudocohnilembus persalinus]|uniref:Uncharacterized protein n=1 Tax=Pseudocohnilembus persalinus TaxID=266149 RepID=A0A0V0QTP3_PSEPJ|nr:hypothetical protein PPERSA_12747 [Pseudocohnilembus persalinus]|eukprot:KRX05569.1 hypothetical protein PPERSA_12747 [Pseudocohnilembus persalinus]
MSQKPLSEAPPPQKLQKRNSQPTIKTKTKTPNNNIQKQRSTSQQQDLQQNLQKFYKIKNLNQFNSQNSLQQNQNQNQNQNLNLNQQQQPPKKTLNEFIQNPPKNKINNLFSQNNNLSFISLEEQHKNLHNSLLFEQKGNQTAKNNYNFHQNFNSQNSLNSSQDLNRLNTHQSDNQNQNLNHNLNQNYLSQNKLVSPQKQKLKDQKNSSNNNTAVNANQYNFSTSIKKLDEIAQQMEKQEINYKKQIQQQQTAHFDPSHKIREYEWYEVETKVRKFVEDLVQPKVSKIFQDQKKFEQKQVDSQNERIDHIEKILLLQNEDCPVVAKIYERIKQIEKSQTNFKQDYQQQQQKNHFEFQQIEKKNQDQQLQIKELQEQINFLNKRNSEILEKVTTEIPNLETQIKELKQLQQQNKIDLTLKIDKNSEKTQEIKNTLALYDKQIQTNQSNIEGLAQDFIQLKSKEISKLKEITKGNSQDIIEIREKLVEISRGNNFMEELSLKFLELESYIEHYQPIYFQANISDILYKILNTEGKKKLVELDQKLFNQFSGD